MRHEHRPVPPSAFALKRFGGRTAILRLLLTILLILDPQTAPVANSVSDAAAMTFGPGPAAASHAESPVNSLPFRVRPIRNAQSAEGRRRTEQPAISTAAQMLRPQRPTPALPATPHPGFAGGEMESCTDLSHTCHSCSTRPGNSEMPMPFDYGWQTGVSPTSYAACSRPCPAY